MWISLQSEMSELESFIVYISNFILSLAAPCRYVYIEWWWCCGTGGNADRNGIGRELGYWKAALAPSIITTTEVSLNQAVNPDHSNRPGSMASGSDCVALGSFQVWLCNCVNVIRVFLKKRGWKDGEKYKTGSGRTHTGATVVRVQPWHMVCPLAGELPVPRDNFIQQ